MIKRRKTRSVNVGGRGGAELVKIGAGAPISVQSMLSMSCAQKAEAVAQLARLKEAGCQIVRVAVPDGESARAIADIKQQTTMPIVADIHFDHRLALLSIEAGADKIRINPGNMKPEGLREVARAARARRIPIRVGVNGGSVDKHTLGRYGGLTAEALCDSALINARMLESNGFADIVMSIKCSDISLMVEATRMAAQRCDYPFHLGVTEAGTPHMGVIKSAAGIGALLLSGIGDTIRVSLTAPPEMEIKPALDILRATGARPSGVELISCPTCGRCQVNLMEIAKRVESELQDIKTPIKVAVMGCAVNGPGEARGADVGIACGDRAGLLFRQGEVVEKLPEDQLLPRLLQEVRAMSAKIR